MANLKEIRTRITSVASTMQITSAMKMVSAAKLKRAQDAITQMRPYAEKLREILVNISSTLEGSAEGAYSQEREVKKVLIVAIASNRGLCGAFNANIFKAAEKRIKEYAEKEVQVYAIGKRSADYFTGKHTVFNSNAEIFNDLNYEHVAVMAEEVMEAFVAGKFNYNNNLVNNFLKLTFATSFSQNLKYSFFTFRSGRLHSIPSHHHPTSHKLIRFSATQ